MSKIARGFHTDTFSPFLFTNLLTYPVSAAHADWHGYPEAFGQALARRTVQDAVGPVVQNVGIEAALVGAIALLATWADRRLN